MAHVLRGRVEGDALFAGALEEGGEEAVVVLFQLLELVGEDEGAQGPVGAAEDDGGGEAVGFDVFAQLLVV